MINNKHSKRLFVILLITCLSIKLNAQKVLLGYRAGFIFPDPRVEGITAFTNSIEGQYWREVKSHSWPKLLNLTEMGVVLKYTDFNNRFVGHGLNPMLLFNIKAVESKKLSLNFSSGAGFSYFTKKFNPGDEVNKAIGSNLTFALRIGGHVKYENNLWELRLGYYVDHYSTGGMTDPNLGANHNNIGLFVGRNLNKNKSIEFKEPFDTKRFNVIVEAGFKELGATKYTHGTFTFFYSGKILNCVSGVIGVNHFFNESLRRVDNQDGKFDNKVNRNGVFVGTQLDFGRSLLNIHYGLFVFNPLKQENNYQHIMYRYFLNEHFSTGFSLRLLSNLNASYAMSLGIGYSF